MTNQTILQVGSALPYMVISRSNIDQLTDCLYSDLSGLRAHFQNKIIGKSLETGDGLYRPIIFTIQKIDLYLTVHHQCK